STEPPIGRPLPATDCYEIQKLICHSRAGVVARIGCNLSTLIFVRDSARPDSAIAGSAEAEDAAVLEHAASLDFAIAASAVVEDAAVLEHAANQDSAVGAFAEAAGAAVLEHAASLDFAIGAFAGAVVAVVR